MFIARKTGGFNKLKSLFKPKQKDGDGDVHVDVHETEKDEVHRSILYSSQEYDAQTCRVCIPWSQVNACKYSTPAPLPSRLNVLICFLKVKSVDVISQSTLCIAFCVVRKFTDGTLNEGMPRLSFYILVR